MAISPFKDSEQQGTLLEILPSGRISLHHCPLGTVGSYSAVAFQFGVGSAYDAELFVNQA